MAPRISSPLPADDFGGGSQEESFLQNAGETFFEFGTSVGESASDFNQNRRVDADPNLALVFPSSLNDLKNPEIRPVLQIAQVNGEKAGRNLMLPCPVGFGVTDGASYNEIELGIIGATANRITNAAISGGAADAAAAAAGPISAMTSKFFDDEGGFQGIQGILDNASSLGAVGVGALASGQAKLPGIPQAAAQGAAVALGISMNKNVTTEFTGVGTRSFAFQYKLVPSSQKEGKMIHEITKFLRSGIYPTKDSTVFGAVLRYPPKFTIKFFNSIGGSRLKSIPAIFECFLESFSTTYNGNNSFHRDGVPVDTDIQFTFKETRALTIEDIDRLESQA